MLFGSHPGAPTGASSKTTLQLLQSVAARADGKCIATLRQGEFAFAMTLQGRCLLERIRKQWDGRPHLSRHQRAKVEVSPTT